MRVIKLKIGRKHHGLGSRLKLKTNGLKLKEKNGHGQDTSCPKKNTNKWTNVLIKWQSRAGTRRQGRQRIRWRDEIGSFAGVI